MAVMTRLQLRPDFEQAVRQLEGVRAVSVVTDAEGVPVEIHVVADPSRGVKQLVRDIQSLAMAEFEIAIDHRIVSVVQIGADKEVTGFTAEPRPALSEVELRVGTQQALVRVTLAGPDDAHHGEAEGPASPTSRPLIIARAKAAAAADLLRYPAVVEQAGITTLGEHRVAVVVAQVADRICVGTALVRGDETDSTVRATLDALNRQINR